jgi:O-glycosyl hydrolase
MKQMKMTNSLMWLRPLIVSLTLLPLLLVGCKEDDDIGGSSNSSLVLTVQTDNVKQTITGFGASDAWSTQFVGENWPISKREQIADWLFSSENDENGSPKGIGLSTWRFNIGAGSAAQGSSSNISDEWRRAPSFLTLGGEFDPSAQPGQRWFLGAAKSRGVDCFTAFLNSPPIALTKNGFAYSSGGSGVNLDSDKYHEFGDFLVDVLQELNSTDQISFEFINPVNEPQWDWSDSGQEGSPWKNADVATFTKIFNEKLENSLLTTKIQLPEAAQLNFLYESGGKSGRDNQIYAFFDPSSANYVGDLSSVSTTVAGHSYFTTWGLNDLVETRKKLASKIDSYPNLHFDMSEYCPLEDNSEIEGNGRDLGMTLALYSARVIHTDLTVANAVSWQWWLAISPYDYKDGLVYIDFDKYNGNIYDSKMLWALGNYSRFIRPGYQRLGLQRSDLREISQTLSGVMASSYKDPDTGKLVVVAINYSENRIPTIVKSSDNSAINWKRYRTSVASDENLKHIDNVLATEIIELPARSITTLVQE